MAYEPTNWKTGDIVTSAKLNKIENALVNAPTLFVVPGDYADEDVLDGDLYQRLMTALDNNDIAIIEISQFNTTALFMGIAGSGWMQIASNDWKNYTLEISDEGVISFSSVEG